MLASAPPKGFINYSSLVPLQPVSEVMKTFRWVSFHTTLLGINLNCWKGNFSRPYVDYFQIIDPIVANIIGQLTEKIGKLAEEKKELKVYKMKKSR